MLVLTFLVNTEIRSFLSTNGGEEACNVNIRPNEIFLPVSVGTFHRTVYREIDTNYHMMHTTIMDNVAMDLHMKKIKNTRLIQ
jgi:hypothetical protein